MGVGPPDCSPPALTPGLRARVTYYIAFFSERVSAPWFYFGQTVYMLWNMLNDPLVGWLSDRAPGLTRRRIPAIKWGGPLWALVFYLAWVENPGCPKRGAR